MGNCIVHQDKVVRVMKTNGKILEYKSPTNVDQVLTQFTNHAISDKLPVVKYMNPDDELLSNPLYYLLPLPVPRLKPKKKKSNKRVRFSDEIVNKEEKKESGVMRIKLMISKQELQAILRDGGVSADDMILQARKENQISEGWLRSLDIVQVKD